MKRLLLIVVALGSMLQAADKAAPATVSGIVKDSANNLLEGVTVTLAKIKNLSMVTKANGVFSLTYVTNVLVPQNLAESHGFSFRNNTIVFTSGSEKVAGTMSLRSIDGRQIASATLNNLHAVEQTLVLPHLSSGTYLFTGTVGNQSFTRALICVGTTMYLENEMGKTDFNTSFSLKKRSSTSFVDTLILSKEGYDTTRYPLTSYTKDGIEIVLKKKGGAGGAFTITSTAFKDGDEMPDAYTCEGKSFTGMIAPPLAWSGAPAKTKSYAMTFLDVTILATTQPTNGYHWAMWNIPSTVIQLAESFDGTLYKQKSAVAQMAGGSNKFFGPCPGKKDTYAFTLYAFGEETINPGNNPDVKTLVTFFSKNAIDSTKISVWSDAKQK